MCIRDRRTPAKAAGPPAVVDITITLPVLGSSRSCTPIPHHHAVILTSRICRQSLEFIPREESGVTIVQRRQHLPHDVRDNVVVVVRTGLSDIGDRLHFPVAPAGLAEAVEEYRA